MKKKGGPQREEEKEVREVKLPTQPEMADRCHEARYGDDSRNPLMGLVELARRDLGLCQQAAPDQPLVSTLIDATAEFDRPSDAWRERWGFHEAAAQALRAGDADFFREVARLLETRIDAPPEQRFDLEVARAFTILRAKLGRLTGQLPTKKQVRETALRAIARDNVMQAQGPKETWLEKCYYQDASGQTQMRPEIRKAVEKEVRRLPEQNWTLIFKRCGLADLPNDKGGQRTHRRQKSG
jgi:hypothetical protein